MDGSGRLPLRHFFSLRLKFKDLIAIKKRGSLPILQWTLFCWKTLKEYKATIRPVTGGLYVCMTVPEELRYILTGQIKRSVGTTN